MTIEASTTPTTEATAPTRENGGEAIQVDITAHDDGKNDDWRDFATKLRDKYRDDRDGKTEATSEDAHTEATDEKPKTAKERAQAKIDQRNFEREARAAQAEAKKNAAEKAELQKQLEALTNQDSLTKIGGAKGLEKLIKDINEDKIQVNEKVLSPAEQELADLKKQVADLAAAKAEHEKTVQEAQHQQAIENDNRFLADHLTKIVDDVPALFASGQWGIDQLRQDCYDHYEQHGEAPSKEDIAAYALKNETSLRKQITPLVSNEKSLFALLDSLPDDLRAKVANRFNTNTAKPNTATRVTPSAPTSKVVRTTSDHGRSTITAADKTVTSGTTAPDDGSYDRESMLEFLRQARQSVRS